MEGIGTANVMTGPRNRKPARRTSTAVNSDSGNFKFSFYSSSATSMRIKPTKNSTSLDRNDSPPELKGWKTITKLDFSKE
ncbi:hypothetical protein HI914_00153 [Erysiphe necator]|nr:hypothetical protein HI914_00153 [Erysiphe necator]